VSDDLLNQRWEDSRILLPNTVEAVQDGAFDQQMISLLQPTLAKFFTEIPL